MTHKDDGNKLPALLVASGKKEWTVGSFHFLAQSMNWQRHCLETHLAVTLNHLTGGGKGALRNAAFG